MLYGGLLALNKQFGLTYLHAVPSTLYGPGYHTDGRQMHFIFDLIRKILRGKLYDEPVMLWGDGQQRRELVFIDDFVDILLRLDRERENETINIGAGEEFTIRHFAELICKHVGFDASRIRYDTSRYVGARSKCLSVRKLKMGLPDLRLTPLDTGLARTIDWFRQRSVLPRPPEWNNSCKADVLFSLTETARSTTIAATRIGWRISNFSTTWSKGFVCSTG